MSIQEPIIVSKDAPSTAPNSALESTHQAHVDPRGVFISTYGCQMNVNDSERMLTLLEMSNYVEVKDPAHAELIIINSCSVREKPVHKVRSEVGTYRELKKKNPRLRIGVGGCVAQQEKDKLFKDAPLVDFVFGTDAVDQLPSLVNQVITENRKIVSAKFEHDKPYQIETLIRNPGVASFVNIGKGCDNFCTFCVVPFTRGREKSRTLKELVGDIQLLTARGVKEVTLLGQNVNSYHSECGANFTELLKTICEDTEIMRIRYTSPHPKDFDQALIDLSQKYRAKICDYLHLPAQSGNTEILALMNRNYSREEYLEKVKMIRAGIPGVALSTDLIVGFPGETEEQFEDTMKLIEEVRYENIYAFAYSPRPFTKAAKFEGQLDEPTKFRRLNKLLDRQRVIAFELAAAYQDLELDVLIEEYKSDEKLIVGRSTQNKLTYILAPNHSPESFIGTVHKVKVSKAFPTVLRGELVDRRAYH
jgi:tRNA-2-methylthio-N6-dimethylallyladenosine synthase